MCCAILSERNSFKYIAQKIKCLVLFKWLIFSQTNTFQSMNWELTIDINYKYKKNSELISLINIHHAFKYTAQKIIVLVRYNWLTFNQTNEFQSLNWELNIDTNYKCKIF